MKTTLGKYVMMVMLLGLAVMMSGCSTVKPHSASVSNLNVVKDRIEIRWKSQKGMKYDIYWTPNMYANETQWKVVHVVKGNGNEMVFTHPDSNKYNSGFYKIMARK